MTTSFIPAKFAHKGRVVKLKALDEWEDGWVVASVGITVDKLPDHRKAIREHRKTTKDSMKKVRK
jgi:hypothetical protein